MPETRKKSSSSSSNSNSSPNSSYNTSMKSLRRLHKRLRKIEEIIQSDGVALDSIKKLEEHTEKMIKLLGSPSPVTRRNRR